MEGLWWPTVKGNFEKIVKISATKLDNVIIYRHLLAVIVNSFWKILLGVFCDLSIIKCGNQAGHISYNGCNMISFIVTKASLWSAWIALVRCKPNDVASCFAVETKKSCHFI